MEANAGMVAGSHSRNELVRIRHGSDSAPKPQTDLNAQKCQICLDPVGLTVDGEVFVACNECGFPVCRACYEYERKEANQSCPQCKTRYKRLKGSPRVDGDDDEEDVDDLDNEFDYAQGTSKARRQWLAEDAEMSSSSRHESQRPIPLLTNGQSMASGEMPSAVTETHSVRSNSGPLGPGDKAHHYLDPRQPVPVRIVDPSKDFNSYGINGVDWKERVDGWKNKQEKNIVQMTNRYPDGKGDMEGTGSNGDELQMADDARQPMSRIVPIPSSQLTPYRVVIILRLIILSFFLQYRVSHSVKDAYPLWLISVICEIWFAISWLLDQFPKWYPINRETFLDRLAVRYDREGEPSQLAPVDVFVSTVDPLKEPPLITANTVLSILAVDYPVDKVSCYVSDDGSSMLTFEALSETSEFARKWVPFCKKHSIEPRAPEFYFAQKIDYLRDKIQPSFVKERRAMKREYEEFKVRINALVAKAQKMPEEGWTMQDGTAWPGNNSRDHPGMIQVFLGHSEGLDTDGNELPRLVYVSREKRPGFQHHKKAGAMNALIRVSAVLTNGAFLLNVDCDHYFNNSKALKEAMCFLMDPALGKKVCYVQFPQRFDGIDLHDRYANRNIVFFDINLKGLDGIQGPVYVGTGCCFNRQALYGYDPVLSEEDLEPHIIVKSCCGGRKKKRRDKTYIDKKRQMKRTESTVPIFSMEDVEDGVEGYEDEKTLLMSQKSLEKRFGSSAVFISASFMEMGSIPPTTNPATLLKEAIHVISCGYEDKTDWGKEIGWIYGSVTEDILTGFKMHARGWISIYCMPPRPAFKGSAPISVEAPFDVFEESPQMRRAPPLVRVQKMFEEIQSKLPGAPKFLLCLLPERKNCALYGPWKKKSLAEYDIVTQCIAPMKVNDQYLTNVLLKVNAKLGGLNSMLCVEHMPSLPMVSKMPTFILGMDVSHGSPGQSDVPSIAAGVSSRQCPLISKYRASVCTQSPKLEMIDFLFKKISHTEDDGIIRRRTVKGSIMASFNKSRFRKLIQRN